MLSNSKLTTFSNSTSASEECTYLFSNLIWTQYSWKFESFSNLIFNRLYLEAVFKRSSHPKLFIKKNVLKNCAKFTRKYLYRSLFLHVFSCEFCKILKSTYLIKQLWATASRVFVKLTKFLRAYFWYHCTKNEVFH